MGLREVECEVVNRAGTSRQRKVEPPCYERIMKELHSLSVCIS
jgi:hypothetical protein